jgi:hypothetical protein
MVSGGGSRGSVPVESLQMQEPGFLCSVLATKTGGHGSADMLVQTAAMTTSHHGPLYPHYDI